MPRDRKYREREEEVAAKGPTVDLNTVHLEWDACQGLRDRLRDAKCLLNTDAKKEESNNACIKNAELLKPLLLRMGTLPKKPLPVVEDLREELQKLLLMHKFTENAQDVVFDTAWFLKRLCGFIKMKCRRREPSHASRLCTLFCLKKMSGRGVSKSVLGLGP